MITFVDTNVLLDILLPDPKYGRRSARAMDDCFNEGSLIINEIIYAELSPQFQNKKLLDEILKTLGIRVMSLDIESAYHAGSMWKKYRDSGGKRNRILADFLIGAHAGNISDRLLTRDRGFYKNYFDQLEVFY